MYDTLLRMWKERKITEAKIRKAVEAGWITQAQAEEILATPQD